MEKSNQAATDGVTSQDKSSSIKLLKNQINKISDKQDNQENIDHFNDSHISDGIRELEQ